MKRLLTLLALAPQTLAQTVYYVDDDGGPLVDFTTLEEAFDAAVPGDRIEVFAGVYGPAELTEGLTVMGFEPGVRVEGLSIRDLPADQVAVLADIDAWDRHLNAFGSPTAFAEIVDCAGTVFVDRVGMDTYLQVQGSADVRLSGLDGGLSSGSVYVTDSFVQVASSNMRGTTSLTATRSEVVVSDSTLIGLSAFFGTVIGIGICQTYDGYPAVGVFDHSRVTVLRSTVFGGHGSFCCGFGCPPGEPGAAFIVDGTSVLRRCQVPGIGTTTTGGLDLEAGAIDLEVDDLPSLALTGGYVPGTTAVFGMSALPGSSARIWAGRFPDRTPFGPWIPWLHTRERGASLGSLPASGQRDVAFVIPPLPRGTLVHGQAMRTLGNGQSELSNSVTLVVR